MGERNERGHGHEMKEILQLANKMTSKMDPNPFDYAFGVQFNITIWANEFINEFINQDWFRSHSGHILEPTSKHVIDTMRQKQHVFGALIFHRFFYIIHGLEAKSCFGLLQNVPQLSSGLHFEVLHNVWGYQDICFPETFIFSPETCSKNKITILLEKGLWMNNFQEACIAKKKILITDREKYNRYTKYHNGILPIYIFEI
ncbi:hypothetical protein ACJX0J_012100 [Zea mays]